jgi:hypothetical protein
MFIFTPSKRLHLELINIYKPHLDVQYIRQIYQGFGWSFVTKEDEAFNIADQSMDKLAEH